MATARTTTFSFLPTKHFALLHGHHCLQLLHWLLLLPVNITAVLHLLWDHDLFVYGPFKSLLACLLLILYHFILTL